MRTILMLWMLCAGCVGPTLGGDDDDGSPADNEPEDVVVDLLIVMDSSQSMARIQEDMAQNLPAPLQALIDAGASLRVGVTTTDLDRPGPGNQGNLRGAGPVGQGACSDGAAIVDGDPNFVASLSNLLDVGVVGAGEEKGLRAGLLAACKAGDNDFWAGIQAADPDSPLASACLQVPADERACNANFRRDSAELVVLIVSDEGDASSNDGVYPTATWLDDCQSSGDGECACRTSAFVEAYAALDARVFVFGPSYQEGESPWCDGTDRDIPGPCNPFSSPACSIDLQQDVACGTGAEWWPIEVSAGALCNEADFGSFATSFVGSL